ncbi:hypothetical protein L7F22_005696 [Adiantum nelumboides]|nr:hypothetical protein [Adiantum nelumboides]
MRYYAPFQITEKINDVSFRLKLPDTWKIHNAFHVSLLKPFKGDVPDDGELDEQPEVEENEEILVPEQIFAHKDRKNKGKVRRRFLVKFKNYPALDAKWMEEEDLADTPALGTNSRCLLRRFMASVCFAGVIEGDYNAFKRGCAHVFSMGGDVGCLLAEAGWLFVGLPNEVQALNLQTRAEQRLSGPVGQVHALAIYNDTLIAGAQDGNILAWKFNSVVNMFQPAAALPGHTGAVVTLEASEGKLYSGAMDFTIRVWDLSTAICIQTLQGHSNVVMGLLSWNQYLLSGSLDGTVKVWAASQSGSYDLQYTYPKDTGSNEDMDGVLAFCGFVDNQNKNILLCALNDNTVHLLELPSFTDRGVLYTKDEVRALQVGPGGLVFSGDGSGSVKVWKWAPS